MFCPFIGGECREDCTFRHVERACAGGIVSRTSHCILAIAADQLDMYVLKMTGQAEDQKG